MNIGKIIYCNKTTGFAEPCSRGDYSNIKDLIVYGRKYIPQRHLEKLILDKKITYKCYGYGVPDFVAMMIHCPSNGIRIFSIEFTIIEMNEEHIIVNVAERVDLADNKKCLVQENIFYNPSYAKIEYVKKKDLTIGDFTGDAAIIVFDAQGANCAMFYYDNEEQYVAANLGRFALAIGFSLFVEMDGEWYKMIEDADKHLMSAGEKLDNARKENTELKQENRIKENVIKDLSHQNDELNNLVEDMKNKLQSYQEELTKTRKWAYDILHFNEDGDDNLDVSNEKDWEKFQSKVLELTEKMKTDSLKIDTQNRLKTIKNACIKKYDRFDESDLSFLATGEYLLEMHKEDSMDFSPVLIAFAKCVEGVLAKYLARGLVVPEDERPMLGNSLIYIKHNSLLLNLTQAQTITVAKQLEDFIKYRNKAAHKEGVTLEEVLLAKVIVFESLEVFNKNCLLDFIHSSY